VSPLAGFAGRVRVRERMDAPDVDPRLLRKALHNIRRCNRFLGGTRALLAGFDVLAKDWAPGRCVVFADVGTGSADLPRALVARGAERGFTIEVVAVDLHAQTIRSARAGPITGLELVRGDARALPLADRSVDYAMSAMLLHHLSDEEAVAHFAELGRIARAGVIVHDLSRSVRSWLWITALTRLFGDPITRFDGPASVRQAFLPEEARALAEGAGLREVLVRRHFGHRFELRGEPARATRGPGR
jgi:hypothetical protein